MSCNVTQQLTKQTDALNTEPKRAEVKTTQHNRLDANSFFPIKLWKQTRKLHQCFWGSNGNFRDGSCIRDGQQREAQEIFYALLQHQRDLDHNHHQQQQEQVTSVTESLKVGSREPCSRPVSMGRVNRVPVHTTCVGGISTNQKIPCIFCSTAGDVTWRHCQCLLYYVCLFC